MVLSWGFPFFRAVQILLLGPYHSKTGVGVDIVSSPVLRSDYISTNFDCDEICINHMHAHMTWGEWAYAVSGNSPNPTQTPTHCYMYMEA